MATANDKKPSVQGEGDYKAAEEYGKGVERFVKSGEVEPAAAEAIRALDEDGAELEAAEAEGRARTAEEDPEISRDKGPRRRPRDPAQPQPPAPSRPPHR